MLQAMNTGHDGSLSTGHSNGCIDMLSRIETMVLMGIDLPVSAIRAQIASGIDVLVHLGRLRDKSRRVLEVVEITGYNNGSICLNPIFRFHEKGFQKNQIVGCWEQIGTLENRKKLVAAGFSAEVLM